MNELLIERFGTIIKEEDIWCLSDAGIPNTCVLESMQPFPGYYGDIPNNSKPHLVYFVTRQPYCLEELTRIWMKIRDQIPVSFRVATSQIEMLDNRCDAIRISQVEDYAHIRKIQEAFGASCIAFKKPVKRIENTPARIHIKKFFSLHYDEVSQIYTDTEQKNSAYFSIPKYLDWESFKKIILNIKNNWSGSRFDAASGFFYENAEIVDIVRIYSEQNSPELMQELRTAFFHKLA